MAIDSVDKAYAAASSDTALQQRVFSKSLGAAFNAADVPINLMPYGNQPAARNPNNTKAATPLTNALTTGIIPFTDPSGSNKLIMESIEARLLDTGLAAGDSVSVIIIDRLLEYGGFVGNSAAAQGPTNASAIPRYVDGVGVQMAAVVSAAPGLGVTPVTLTITYDSDSTVGSTVAVTTRTDGTVLGRVIHGTDYFIPIAQRGVKKITQVQLSATTGGAGQYAIFLFKVLGSMLLKRAPDSKSFALGPGRIFPRIYPGAALDFFLVQGSPTGVNLANAGVSGILNAMEG
jgi:hypothetical protein